jgi:ATP-dependent DNA helicase RecQ
VTPERLSQPEFVALIRRTAIDLLVVDEAHCISRWGHDFRPAYQEIGAVLRLMPRAGVLALTATASPDVQADIRRELRIPADGVIAGDSHRPNLRLAVDAVDSPERKLAQAQAHLRRAEGQAIVYTATVKAAEALHQALLEQDFSAGLYHGRLPAAARRASQQAFMQDEQRVMVATNAFGLGINKPDIRLVLHYQMPAALDVYYQEAGRAGRDGQPADCVLLYQRSDRAVQQFFLNGRYPSVEDAAALLQALAAPPAEDHERTPAALARQLQRPLAKLRVLGTLLRRHRLIEGPAQGPWRAGAKPASARDLAALLDDYVQRSDRDRDRLEAMVGYAQSGRCRWRMLLEFFEEAPGFERCGECDNCRRMADHERQAQEAGPAEPAAGQETTSGASRPRGRSPTGRWRSSCRSRPRPRPAASATRASTPPAGTSATSSATQVPTA